MIGEEKKKSKLIFENSKIQNDLADFQLIWHLFEREIVYQSRK